MAVSIDVAASAGNTALANTHVFSVTVGNNPNRCLYILGGFGRAADSTTMTISSSVDGALTAIGSQIHAGGGSNGYMQWFFLLNPTVGAHTITITVTSSGTRDICAGYASLHGVHQTVPHNGPTTATGTSVTSSVTRASSAGNLVLFGHGAGSAFTAATATQTERWLNNVSGSFALDNLECQTAAGAASVSSAMTVSSSDSWSAIGLDVAAAAAATVIQVPQTLLFQACALDRGNNW